MATSDQEQKSINVPQHKRLAMGVPLTGQTMQGNSNSGNQPKKGALEQAKKK